MAVKIEKETIIGDVLDIAPQSAPLFFDIGMHGLGCPSSRGETVEEACMVHGIACRLRCGKRRMEQYLTKNTYLRGRHL